MCVCADYDAYSNKFRDGLFSVLNL